MCLFLEFFCGTLSCVLEPDTHVALDWMTEVKACLMIFLSIFSCYTAAKIRCKIKIRSHVCISKRKYKKVGFLLFCLQPKKDAG